MVAQSMKIRKQNRKLLHLPDGNFTYYVITVPITKVDGAGKDLFLKLTVLHLSFTSLAVKVFRCNDLKNKTKKTVGDTINDNKKTVFATVTKKQRSEKPKS